MGRKCHIARMDDSYLPKKLLFGGLPQQRPVHGTEQRWRDKVRKDLKQRRETSSMWHRTEGNGEVCLTVCTEERPRKERSRHDGSAPLLLLALQHLD